jgi:GNAT superfamily N-acetyltransferase
MIVRDAELRDVEAIAALAGELGYPTTSDAMARRLAALGGRDAVLVADDGGACVGWIHVSVIDSLETDRHAEIRGLVVASTHRSAGIGAALVRAAEEWARRRELGRVRVRSNVMRERTHRFYERLGYRAVKSQKVFDKS